MISGALCDQSFDYTTDLDACTSTQGGNVTAFITDNCTASSDLTSEVRVENVDGTVVVYTGPVYSHAFQVGVSRLTLTVIDEAGNVSSCSSNVVVNDSQLPSITCPTVAASYDNAPGECGYTAGVEFNPTFSDNCIGTTVSHDYGDWANETSLEGAVFPVGTTTVTWTATDASGNSATCTVTIVVNDNENPAFVNCPTDTVTIGADSDCSNGVVWSIPVATDNCVVDSVTQTGGPAYGTALTPGTYNIEYTATDGAGNTAVCTFTIIVEDDDNPYLVCQPDITVSTDAGVCQWSSTTNLTDPSLVRDNCPGDVLTYTVTFADATTTNGTGTVPAGTVFQNGVNTISYTLTDAAGNSVSCSSTVTVEDNEAPVNTFCVNPLFSGSDVTSNDTGLCSATLDGFVVVTDNCDAEVTIEMLVHNPDGTLTLVEWDYEGNNEYTSEYTFQVGVTTYTLYVTDSSGNSSYCTYQQEVTDEENPAITCATLDAAYDTDLGSCEYMVQGAQFDPVVSDNCAVESVMNNYNFTSSLANTMFDVGTTEVVWTVTDIHGNTNTCAITVVVEDNENPVAGCVSEIDAVLDADGSFEITTAMVELNSSDNCGNITIEGISRDGGAYGEYIFVSCEDLPPSVNFVEVTLLVSDEAGNESTCTTNVEVYDLNPPVTECQNIVVQLNADGEVSITPQDVDGGSTDNCSISNLTIDIDEFDCSNVGANNVTLTVTDVAGNTAVCVSTVTVEDNIAPTFTCPQDITLASCEDTVPDLVALVTDADDNCGIASIIQSVPAGSVVGLINEASIAITVTVTDVNGNMTTCDVNVLINDEIDPFFVNCPVAPITVDLFTDICMGSAVWSIPVAEDNCGLVTVTQIAGPVSGDPIVAGEYTVTYVAIDAAGNTDTCNFDIIVVDTQEPVVICPGNVITAVTDPGTCSWTAPEGVLSPLYDFANCPSELTYEVVFPSDPSALNVSVVEWNFEDATKRVTPNLPYTADAGTVANLNTSAINLMGGSAFSGWVQGGNGTGSAPNANNWQSGENSKYWMIQFNTQGLENLRLSSMMRGSNTGPRDFTIEYSLDGTTWAAVPASTFQVNTGWTGGVTSLPLPSDLNDQSNAWLRWIMTSNVSVNGGTVASGGTNRLDNIVVTGDLLSNSIAGNGDATGVTFPLGISTVFYTITEDNGMALTCSFQVVVSDNQGPEFTCPDDMEVPGCAGVVSDLITGLTGTDNCGGDVTFTQNPVAGSLFGPDPGDMVIVTVTGSDEYGNTTSCEVELTIIDDEMPYFVNCPQGVLMYGNDTDECGATVNWSIPVALDNCADIMAPSTIVQTVGNPPGSFFDVGGPYTVTYTATDNDGNSAVCSWTFEVLDTQEPEILVGKPQNETVGCDNIPDPLVLNQNDVEDNCTEEPVIEFVQNSSQDPNQAVCDHYTYTLENVWTVSDDAGNEQVWVQIVEVVDTVAPQLTTPIDITVECEGVTEPQMFVCNPATGMYAPTPAFAKYGVAVATDNCTPAEFICIEFSDVFTQGPCGYTGVITRTWTATDPCGNQSTGVQVITIEDTTAPDFECMDIIIDLNENGEVSITAGDVIVGGIDGATDMCSDIDDLTFQLSKTAFTCADLGDNQVLVVVKDDCGNEAACFATVTVRDVTPPTLICPRDQVFQLPSGECTFQWPGGIPAEDNCGAVVTYDPADLILPIGTNVITVTATDEAGNTATCSFTVIVNENIPNGTLACNNHINLSLDTNCEAVINPDMILEGNNYRCFDNYCIEITTTGGVPHPNFFDISDKDQTFIVSITDCNGNGSSCWGYVTIEEKLVPEIVCPENVTVSCNTDINERFIITLPDDVTVFGDLKTGEAFLETCKPGAVITYKDWVDDFGQCANPRAIVTRTWTATFGNESVSCDQIITIEALNLDNIVWPQDFTGDNALECFDVNQRPSLVDASHTGYPVLGDTPINKAGNLCMVSINVSDEIYDVCPGSYEILRTWKVRNMCLPVSQDNPRTHVQVIKINDTKGPKVVECPQDITVGVDPWDCKAATELPVPSVMWDQCSDNLTFSAKVFGTGRVIVTGGFLGHQMHDIKVRVEGLNKGRHLVEYVIRDECGNASTCYFHVTVADFSAPVAIALENIVVSLTNSGTDSEGNAKLYADMVDNGSYDHCSDVRLEIRRKDGGDCGNIGADGRHNNNSTFNHSPNDAPNQRWAHPEDTRGNNVIDNDGGEYVKFCCEDIPAGEDFGLHEVELRVWDDGNMNAVIGDNDIIDGLRDNYNTTWATIRVENKLPPQLVCPPDVTMTCDMEVMFASDWTDVSTVDLSMTGMPVAYDLCSNLMIEYRDQFSGNDVCNIGTIRRTFRVTKGSTVVTCRQEIELIGAPSVFGVVFPQNNGTTEWDECVMSLEDVRNTSDVRIKRPIVNYSACDIVGENIKIDTFLFEDGACKKWRVEYNYINWCTEETSGPWVHYYTYKDETAPVLTCNDQMFAANPNPQNPEGGCEGSVRLEASATDSLVCADESWVKWQMFMDGWNNGTVDRLGSSFVNKAWFGIWVSIPRFISGALNPAWVALQDQHPGVILDDLVYATYIRPTAASGGGVSLPSFTMDAENISHKVTWKITDGCGNVDQCESTVMVVDKKAPTPYCVSISTALMQGNPRMVELWARDFDQGAFDNCTPQSKLYFTFDGVAPIFDRIAEEHFYKAGANNTTVNATSAEYNSGRAYKWLPSTRSAGKVFTQAGTINLNVDVWDEAWNTDFCTVALTIRGDANKVQGSVMTYTEQPVRNVIVTADSNEPEFPMSSVTDADGNYSIDIPDNANFTVGASKDTDYLNGITTLDLVLIQRHLLDIQPFVSPYQHVAGDVNDDSRITASDLTELRKLILGVSPDFTNQSWRFPVSGTAVDTDGRIAFTETAENAYTVDFVAVKIGDVNLTATYDVSNPNIEPRTSSQVILGIDNEKVPAGQTVRIPVYATQFESVTGFQYTMNLKGMVFEGIEAGAIQMTEDHVGVLSGGHVTMSYASAEPVKVSSDEILFTLIVKTEEAGSTMDMVTLTSDITKAESYDGMLKVGSINMTERTASEGEIVLMQNEPNPFKTFTKVSFEMPVAAEATITVTDVTGKVIVTRELNAERGVNTVEFTREELGISGVLFYTLTSGGFSATKKMIVVE